MAVIVPNTVFEYTINSDGTFLNKRVDSPSFIEEIQSSAIVPDLVSVIIVNGNCRIAFVSNLSDAEILILDGLVIAHTASPVSESHMIPYIWQVKNPVADQAVVAMGVMGFANIIDEYNCMRPAVPTGLNIRLKNPLTAGSITLTITKNGVATNKSMAITSADARRKLWILKTSDLLYEKTDAIGILYATSADMLPTADNELNVNIEMAWKTL